MNGGISNSESKSKAARIADRSRPMRDSGVSWIGEVPVGWECCKLRQFLTSASRKGYADKKLLSVTREQGVIVRDTESKEENHNFIPDDLSNYKLVEIGDFAVNKMKSWQGSYGVSQHEGIVSPAYYIFKVNGVDGSFSVWQFAAVLMCHSLRDIQRV